MIAAAKSTERVSNFDEQKYIFNCEAYRLDGENWVRLEKLFIDNQFDNKASKSITKVKIKGQKGFQSTFIVKITFNEKNYFYSMTQELQLGWVVHILKAKISQTVQLNLTASEYINVCAGNILKKASFFGDWEKCFVMITQDGLTVARDEKQKPDLQIKGVRQIWTRFELVEANSHLVFKLRDFFKYEFGVPIDLISKWTKAFYSLISFD